MIIFVWSLKFIDFVNKDILFSSTTPSVFFLLIINWLATWGGIDCCLLWGLSQGIECFWVCPFWLYPQTSWLGGVDNWQEFPYWSTIKLAPFFYTWVMRWHNLSSLPVKHLLKRNQRTNANVNKLTNTFKSSEETRFRLGSQTKGIWLGKILNASMWILCKNNHPNQSNILPISADSYPRCSIVLSILAISQVPKIKLQKSLNRQALKPRITL